MKFFHVHNAPAITITVKKTKETALLKPPNILVTPKTPPVSNPSRENYSLLLTMLKQIRTSA